jgi:hypothetical protein
MSKILLYLFLLPITFNSKIAAQSDSTDLIKATEYFNEARILSDNDNGNLWGMKLYGPILFVNPQTHYVIANEQDSAGYLKKTGGLFCGQLPIEMNVSNTSVIFNGTKWTMLVWPLTENKFQRKILLMHELFHRIQDKLNLPLNNPASNHLDKKEGRILFRMEWKELVSSLQSKGDDRTAHIKNAILLNKYRKELYPGADTLESQLEMNEGLAEYTGFKLSGEPEDSIISFWAQRINIGEKIPSFVRSFAYITSPMYGFLLDNSGKLWRNKISEVKSLSDLLAKSYSIKLSGSIKDEALNFLMTKGDPEILNFEAAREKKMEEQTAALKEKFFHKPAIIMRLENMNVQFDPRNLIPIDSVGTVYPNIRISDNWGILDVKNEAFLASDWKSIIVSLPEKFKFTAGSDTIKTEDWTLEMKKGWTLKSIAKQGCYTVAREEK